MARSTNGQLDDWRTNARNIYGTRGFLAPIRTDGESGHMLHFDDSFAGQTWIGGADWLLYPLLEYCQVTDDSDFYKNKLAHLQCFPTRSQATRRYAPASAWKAALGSQCQSWQGPERCSIGFTRA